MYLIIGLIGPLFDLSETVKSFAKLLVRSRQQLLTSDFLYYNGVSFFKARKTDSLMFHHKILNQIKKHEIYKGSSSYIIILIRSNTSFNISIVADSIN